MTTVVKMVEPFALNAPTDGSAGSKTAPFPVPSQIPLGSPGNASLNDGFTALNMTPQNMGGLPMSGPDLNGILYLMSTTIAALNAGQLSLPYDAAFQTAIGGYPVGAVLQQAANPVAVWVNIVANNLTNPDGGGSVGWISSCTLYGTAPLTGTDNVVLYGPSDYVIDIPTATNFTGFVAQRDGQRITLCQTTANTVQFTSLSGSSGSNQLRIPPAGIALTQYDSFTLQYLATLAKWVPV